MVVSEQVTKSQELVRELKVADVMTTQVITIHPKALVGNLREVLRINRISGVPVVDGNRLVGIVSIEDFITCLADGRDDCAIEEMMSRRVETLYADDPLVHAIDKFGRTGLGRFPVVERERGVLVGIVTKGNVIRGLLKKLEINYHQEESRRNRSNRIFDDIEADGATLIFQYDVPGKDFKHAGEGSCRLKRTLNRIGIRPDVVRRLAIASYEAEMNLVIYTDGGKMAAQVQPNAVFVDVEDSGPGIPDVEQALQPGYSTAADWVRELGFGAGMGLPNIKKMSDEFHIQSEVGKGTLLKIKFSTVENQHEAR
jgi:CBS domain-containing protein/anti-sigma regulatory factor (Ser/Thr protein kinase)